ncbi:MAG: hypothetical protein UHD09_04425 [Bifidobacterium sp.]|nr:hypothetical protein [Bifidobacterium sp.]
MKAHHAMDDELDGSQGAGRCAVATSDTVRRALRRRVAEGTVVEPFPRCFARVDYWNGLTVPQRAAHVSLAYGRLHPKQVLAGPSALCLHPEVEQAFGLHDPAVVTVVTTHGSRIAAVGGGRGHVRHVHVEHIDSVRVGGVLATPLERAIVDCAVLCEAELAIGTIDWALRKWRTLERLQRIKLHKVEDALKVVWLLGFADARAENGGESRARYVIHDLGFAPPQLQVEFPNPDNPEFPLRVDFLWVLPDGSIVVAEYDGMAKYGDGTREVLAHAQRQERRDAILKSHGVRAIVHFTFEDLLHPERLWARLMYARVPLRPGFER